MNRLMSPLRHVVLCASFVLPLAAQADPVSYFVPFSGEGNLSVFDAAAGTGGWVGSLVQSPVPPVAAPLDLVSVVLFTLDAASRTLMGTFEFTTTDLMSTLFGDLTGSYVNADILTTGGQFSIDYRILGGTGNFFRASGFGLSFVDFNPAGVFNNYTEAGLLNFDVPEPGTALLAGLALLAAIKAGSRRQTVRPSTSADRSTV